MLQKGLKLSTESISCSIAIVQRSTATSHMQLYLSDPGSGSSFSPRQERWCGLHIKVSQMAYKIHSQWRLTADVWFSEITQPQSRVTLYSVFTPRAHGAMLWSYTGDSFHLRLASWGIEVSQQPCRRVQPYGLLWMSGVGHICDTFMRIIVVIMHENSIAVE